MIFDNFHPQVHGYSRVEEATGLVGKCRIVRGDVANAEELRDAVRSFNPELIYHLAAETGTGQSYDEPTRYNLVNVIGTSNLIEAVRTHGKAVRRIVLSGSRAIYGEGAAYDTQNRLRNAPPRRIEDMRRGDFDLKDERGAPLKPVPTPESLAAAPASIYASTKLMQEYVCTQCAAGTDLEVVILRLQNVYGPGQSLRNPYTGVISIFCQQGGTGRMPGRLRGRRNNPGLRLCGRCRRCVSCLHVFEIRASLGDQHRIRIAGFHLFDGKIRADALRAQPGRPPDHRGIFAPAMFVTPSRR